MQEINTIKYSSFLALLKDNILIQSNDNIHTDTHCHLTETQLNITLCVYHIYES